MTFDHITTLTATGESETLEFTQTTGTCREAAMTVYAFLNQRGGQVLFGVTNASVAAGQQVSERTIEELSTEFRQIDPPAFPKVERIHVDGDRVQTEGIVARRGKKCRSWCRWGIRLRE